MFHFAVVALVVLIGSEETTTTTTLPRISCSNSTLFALEDFFHSTGGMNWSNNDGWLEDEFCCEWFGIETCNDEAEITKLEMTGNNLVGTLGDSLSALTSLTSLAVRLNNGLHGTIPDSYGNLTSLKRIYLHENSFTGTFPESFANLLDLEYIYIYRNEISGTLPTSWASLTKLYLLNLHSNQITGTLPSEWGAWEDMTYLYLSHNHLTGTFPAEWQGMANLWTLSISHNQFTGHLPHYLLEHPIYMLQAAVNNWCCPVIDYSNIEKNDHWRMSCQNDTLSPSSTPSKIPTLSFPSVSPSLSPSDFPSLQPSNVPTISPVASTPTGFPLVSSPTSQPSPTSPSSRPSQIPTILPSSTLPTSTPLTTSPSMSPSFSLPSKKPSRAPSPQPSLTFPSYQPSTSPFPRPSQTPTPFPTLECIDDNETITLVMGTFIFSNSQVWACSDVSEYFFRCETQFAYYFINHQSFPRDLLYTTFGDVCEVTCGRCDPSTNPTSCPSTSPTLPIPTRMPSSEVPTIHPSSNPSTTTPSSYPLTSSPTIFPSPPTTSPSSSTPSVSPTISPSTSQPSLSPIFLPSVQPTFSIPSTWPSLSPLTQAPSAEPSTFPTHLPSLTPSLPPLTSFPTISPSNLPSTHPTLAPSSDIPSENPSISLPSFSPSKLPSHTPTHYPITSNPTAHPTPNVPSSSPSKRPHMGPSRTPVTSYPSFQPTTEIPSSIPTTELPSSLPTYIPSFDPSTRPTNPPVISDPSRIPSKIPTPDFPSQSPSPFPTSTLPTKIPSMTPTFSSPSPTPSELPTSSMPTIYPTNFPTSVSPSFSPTINPTTSEPTEFPSERPTTSLPSAMPQISPTSSVPTNIPTQIPTPSQPTSTPISLPPSKGPTFSTRVTFDVECDFICQGFGSRAKCLEQFTDELGLLLSSQSLLVNLNIACGSIIVDVSGRDPHVSLAVAFLLAYCHKLPSFPTICGPNVFSPSKSPSISDPSFRPSRQTFPPSISQPSESPFVAPSPTPIILENSGSETILDVSAASSHPPFHQSVGFFVVVILIFLLFVLWMYCHYGPKIKLVCFCDKDDRSSIEFANFPKNIEMFEGGGAQTIPSVERKDRKEGEMGDGFARFESSSRIVSYSAHSQQIEGLSEPGSQLNLSEIALFSMQTAKGDAPKPNSPSQYPHDGDEFDDDTHSDSGSLYGGAESPGATPKTSTHDAFEKRCPSVSSIRVGDTSEADETLEEVKKRFHKNKTGFSAGGFWKPFHDDSDYLGMDEASDSISSIGPKSRPAKVLKSRPAHVPKSRPDVSFEPPSFIHNHRDKSASIAPGSYGSVAGTSYSSQEFKLRKHRSQSEITPRSPSETPGSPALSKETKRFPRRRVLSRARYFE